MMTNNLEQARFNMVEQQIRPWEVLDPRVLALLSEMSREEFVPENYRQLAFADIEIPIGHGQKMTAPRIEARTLQALDIQPTDNILEIGTGSGYLTACLAKLGGKVTSLDIHAEFTAQAEQQLQAQGIENVTLQTGDALSSAIDGGPFDVIAVTGSVTEVGDGMKRQLREGGRMFVVTGEAPLMEAMLITRVGDDQWREEALFETVLTPLDQSSTAKRFIF